MGTQVHNEIPLSDLDMGAMETETIEAIRMQDRLDTIDDLVDAIECSRYVKQVRDREAGIVDVLEAAARLLLPGVRMELDWIGETEGTDETDETAALQRLVREEPEFERGVIADAKRARRGMAAGVALVALALAMLVTGCRSAEVMTVRIQGADNMPPQPVTIHQWMLGSTATQAQAKSVPFDFLRGAKAAVGPAAKVGGGGDQTDQSDQSDQSDLTDQTPLSASELAEIAELLKGTEE